MQQLQIDFISDVACPWCAVGLASLLKALDNCADVASASLRLQPLELNPDEPPEGEDATAHLARKYGSTPERRAEIHDLFAKRGAALGLRFAPRGRTRVVNTFNAHRLIHWAGEQSARQQLALKQALLRAYHERDQRVDHTAVLLDMVREAGLDVERARQILAGDEFATQVRVAEARWQEAGIHSVPSIIINGRYAINGGQLPIVFEQALRKVAQGLAESPSPTRH